MNSSASAMHPAVNKTKVSVDEAVEVIRSFLPDEVFQEFGSSRLREPGFAVARKSSVSLAYEGRG
jgi:hypothetical protein